MSDAHEFFRGELAGVLWPGENVEATGYFQPRMGRGVGGGISAARTGAFYMALTNCRLILMRTRTPAFSAPLLENEGIDTVALDELGVSFDGQELRVASPTHVLTLEAALTNKHLPEHETLVSRLAELAGTTLSEVRDGHQRATWIRYGIGAALFVVGAVVVHLTS